MNFSILSTGVVLLAQLVSAVPTPTEDGLVERGNIMKRATITNVHTTGYATQNGEATGGKGGTTTTVSTLAQFTAACTDDTIAKVIDIQGTITGALKQRVCSNKTLIGLPGASMSNFRPQVRYIY